MGMFERKFVICNLLKTKDLKEISDWILFMGVLLRVIIEKPLVVYILGYIIMLTAITKLCIYRKYLYYYASKSRF